jgi:D-sedoheptulose 7-phosphate isomerase
MTSLIREKLGNSISTLQKVMADEALLASLGEAAIITGKAMLAGHKLLIAGNGGSAADAQHLAAEFVNRLTIDRPAMPALALTTDTSALTSIGNDSSFDKIFSRQLDALGRQGDIFLGISTSGDSRNVIKALEQSRKMGIATIGFSGRQGGMMQSLCDFNIVVPSAVTANIQEAHLVLEHIFCHLVERTCFGQELFACESETTGSTHR